MFGNSEPLSSLPRKPTIYLAATLVTVADEWRFEATGTDLGTGWRNANFTDSAWSTGFAPFGWGGLAVLGVVRFLSFLWHRFRESEPNRSGFREHVEEYGLFPKDVSLASGQ